MAKAIAGRKILHYYRLLSKAGTVDGKKLLFPTEDSEKISNDVETTKTKDGSEVTPQGAEVTLSSSNLLADDDPTTDDLKKACKEGLEVEAWVVNLGRKSTTANKYKGTYYRGFITSFESSNPTEGFSGVSIEFSARGAGADGDVTVPSDDLAEATAVYDFADLSKVTASGEGS